MIKINYYEENKISLKGTKDREFLTLLYSEMQNSLHFGILESEGEKNVTSPSNHTFVDNENVVEWKDNCDLINLTIIREQLNSFGISRDIINSMFVNNHISEELPIETTLGEEKIEYQIDYLVLYKMLIKAEIAFFVIVLIGLYTLGGPPNGPLPDVPYY